MEAATTMTRDVVFVTPEQPLAVAYRRMTAGRIRHLPVVSQGRLVGILSDRDVLLAATRRDGEIVVPHVPVSEVMTEAPITIRRDTSVSRAAELMIEYKIDALPVVEGNRLIGLVTSTDLLVLLIGDNDEISRRPLPFEFALQQMTNFAA